MNFLLHTIWFYVLLLFIPVGIGALLLPNKKIYAPDMYISGLFASFAIYEMYGLICSMIFETSLTFLTALWIITVGILSVSGWRTIVRKRTEVISKQKEISGKEKLLLFLVLIPMLVAVIRAFTGYVTNVDDSFYVAQSTTAIYTDTINQFNPMTGEFTGNPCDGYYYIPMWPIYWASISQLTLIHPAIIMHTLLPTIMIPCAYATAFLVLRKLFNENASKALMAIFVLEISYEIVSCTDGMKQWWLMLCSWMGKSVAPNMVAPFLVYLFLCMEKAQPGVDQNRFWGIITLVVLGGCLVAGSCFTMIPFLLGVLAIAYWLRTRDATLCIKIFWSAIPCVIFMIWSLVVPEY